MKPEANTYYKCADGSKAYVGYIREDGVAVGHVYHKGQIFVTVKWGMDGASTDEPEDNLVAEWVEPKPVEVWLNVFEPFTRSLTHLTKDGALSASFDVIYTIGLRLWPDRDPEVIERIVHGEGK